MLPAAQIMYRSMIGWFVNNELEMDRRNCPYLIPSMDCPTWCGTPSKDVHCIFHHMTYRTLKQLLEITSPSYQACFTSGEYITKNCLQWLSTITETARLKISLKSSSVCVRGLISYAVFLKNQPHIIATWRRNWWTSWSPTPPPQKKTRAAERTVNPFCSKEHVLIPLIN